MQEEKLKISQTSENNKRIAKNTFMLYTRQILILFVSLYTVRVVLDVLGVEDYGIYNVIGGIVTLFSFLSGTMASATQRFFSFALGEKNQNKLNKIFSVNLIIYLGIAILAVLLLETIGLWFVKNELVVPPERLESVVFIFHFSVLIFVTTIFTAPFMAIIIAHEDMQYYAYISIIEIMLKLCVVFLLVYIQWDKLELYSMLLFGVSIITIISYLGVCVMKYKECQFSKLYWDKKIVNEILGFTGWTLFGQITTVSRNQAVTILLNQAFSPITVAARAIATSIASKVNMFAANFNVGLYPPIIKTYASGDNEGMNKLIFSGSKITFFLMWVFALPLFLEMDMILNVWLKNPPYEAVIFTRLALVEALITSLSNPVATAARAPGRMKTYELTLGLLQFLLFGLAWGALKLGYPAYSVYCVAIAINLVMFIVRLYIVSQLVGLSKLTYFQKVLIPVLEIITISMAIMLSIKYIIPKGVVYSLFIIIGSVFISSSVMYYLGLNKEWRVKVKVMVVSRLQKLK